MATMSKGLLTDKKNVWKNTHRVISGILSKMKLKATNLKL